MSQSYDHRARTEPNHSAISGNLSFSQDGTRHKSASEAHGIKSSRYVDEFSQGSHAVGASNNKGVSEVPRIKPRYVDEFNHGVGASNKAASEVSRIKPRHVDESDQHQSSRSARLGVHASKLLKDAGFSRNIRAATHQETTMQQQQQQQQYTAHSLHSAAHNQGAAASSPAAAHHQAHRNPASAMQEVFSRQKDTSSAPNPKLAKLDISSLYDSIANQVAQRRFETQKQNAVNRNEVGVRIFGAKSVETPFGNVHDFSPLSEYVNGKYQSGREYFPQRHHDPSKPRPGLSQRQTDGLRSDGVGLSLSLSQDSGAKHRHEMHARNEQAHVGDASPRVEYSSAGNAHDAWRTRSAEDIRHESESVSDSYTQAAAVGHGGERPGGGLRTESTKYTATEVHDVVKNTAGTPQRAGSTKSLLVNMGAVRRPSSGGGSVLGVQAGGGVDLHVARAYKSEADYYGGGNGVSYFRDNSIDVSYYKDERREGREMKRTPSAHTPPLTNRYYVYVCLHVCM
jgi:hypothetical protein